MSNWMKENMPDQSGKVFIVTGGNSGVGYETCLGLAEKGASVVLASRDAARGEAASDRIRQQVPDASLDAMALDLASLDSIKAFAKAYTATHKQLHGLINNAGTVGCDKGLTADGFERQFGTNHLGHFALTGLLLTTLLATEGSRVVTVGSRMHADAEMNWDDLMSEQSYDRWEAYKQSKLASMLFAFELARKLAAASSSTLSIAAHPGLAKTNWADNNLSGPMKFIGNLMANLTYQSAAMGALSVLYAATAVEAQSGKYYGPENDTKGYPVETQAGEAAQSETDAKKLWAVSEELTGVHYAQLDQ